MATVFCLKISNESNKITNDVNEENSISNKLKSSRQKDTNEIIGYKGIILSLEKTPEANSSFPVLRYEDASGISSIEKTRRHIILNKNPRIINI